MRKNCCKIWTMRFYHHREICPKDVDGMANSVDRNQTARAIWSEPTLFAQTWLFENLGLLGPLQVILVLIAYASSEGSGEPAHPHSLARTSTARPYKQWVKRNLQTESQIPSPSEWLGMRS